MGDTRLPPVVLSDAERSTLEDWARRRSTAQGLAQRAQIVLACARGWNNTMVAARLGIERKTAARWRRRFLRDRLDWLADQPRPGVPRTITDAQVEEVVVRTLEEVPMGGTHWSKREPAKVVGISPASVLRIWHAFGLQPWRTKTFKIGIDGIWAFVDGRYVTADAHQYLTTRAGTIELVVLQAKTSTGYQETVFEKLHFHLPTLLDMSRDEDGLGPHTNAKLLEHTRRFLHVLENLAASFPQVRVRVIYASKTAEGPHPHVKAKGDRLRRELAKITSDIEATIECLNAADLRERTARGAKAVAELVFSETPMGTSLGEGYGLRVTCVWRDSTSTTGSSLRITGPSVWSSSSRTYGTTRVRPP
ncbi:helix-turn-helix domain-containing protein [Streptomyces sp. NPDC059564]|uniref:helix-turn-helix domain-containing protein n=1 Tax=Streptomyces sp. NPDC059564 TaxID=3346865 RepID=UPI0036941C3A